MNVFGFAMFFILFFIDLLEIGFRCGRLGGLWIV